MNDACNVIHTTRSGPPSGQVGAAPLLLGLAAGPLAWALNLTLSYGFASQTCFSGLMPRVGATGLGWLWWLLIAIDLAGLAGCAAAALLSYRNWRDAPRPLPVDEEVETGEGRSRFLGLWGMATSAVFAAAIIFGFVGLWVLPLC